MRKNLEHGGLERGLQTVAARLRRRRPGSKPPRCLRESASGISVAGQGRRWVGRVRRRGGWWLVLRLRLARLLSFVLGPVPVPERRLTEALLACLRRKS